MDCDWQTVNDAVVAYGEALVDEMTTAVFVAKTWPIGSLLVWSVINITPS